MAAKYKVLKIDELIRPADLGGVEHYSRVTIRTAKGQVATVNIDAVDLTPDKAAPILEKRAAEIDGVMALGG